jgi:hypothetical protein
VTEGKKQPEPGERHNPTTSDDDGVRTRSPFWSCRTHLTGRRILWPTLPLIPPNTFKPITEDLLGQWATTLLSLPRDTFRSINEDLLGALARALPVISPDTFKPLTEAISGQWPTLQRTMAMIATRFAEELGEAAPPNWEMENDWPRLSAITAVVGHGIPIAWVPRGDIVTALIEAGRAEACQAILAAREADIITDCDRCLDSIDDPALDELLDMTRKAVRAFRSTHTEAAQALATTILDTTLRRVFAGERFRYERIRADLESAWDRAPVEELRSTLVLYAIPAALAEFSPNRGDPVPGRFNRHASAHAAGTVQYTRANALLAIMTVTSLLREACASGWCSDRSTARSSA